MSEKKEKEEPGRLDYTVPAAGVIVVSDAKRNKDFLLLSNLLVSPSLPFLSFLSSLDAAGCWLLAAVSHNQKDPSLSLSLSFSLEHLAAPSEDDHPDK